MREEFATIDTETIEFITSLEEEKIGKENVTILSRKDDIYRAKLNLHGVKPIGKLKEYLEVKQEEMQKAEVIAYSNKRLDLCIDSMRNFEETKKISNIIVGLLGIELGEKEVVRTENLYDLKTRSYMLKNRAIEVVIYDKQVIEETYPYPTRTELKVKRIAKGKTELDVIKMLETTIKNSLKHFEELEDLYIDLICKRIDKAQKDNKYSNFKAFVNYNADLFLTKRVFDGVFAYVGIKQKSNKWLENYRKETVLNFESKASLTQQHKAISKAIVTFRGNYKDWDKINKARKTE